MNEVVKFLRNNLWIIWDITLFCVGGLILNWLDGIAFYVGFGVAVFALILAAAFTCDRIKKAYDKQEKK